MSSTSSNPTVRRERAASATATKRAAKSAPVSKSRKHASSQGFSGGVSGVVATAKDALLSSRALMVVAIVVAALLLGLLADTALNWNRAYGNVKIGGVDVGGLNSEEMHSRLDETYGAQLASKSVTVYANEKARDKGKTDLEKQQDEALAEQVSAEEAAANATSWTATGTDLKASLPYDQLIDEAIGAGRSGGPFGRLAVMIAGEDIPVSVVFDQSALDSFAGTIDKAVGDPRVDATVEIEEGVARPIEGHEGTIVDRAWLGEQLGAAMLSDDESASLIAETTKAPSRIATEKAQQVSDGINKALNAGATFSYKSTNWTADAVELGRWTTVKVEETNGESDLKVGVDASLATSSLVKNVSVTPTQQSSDTLTVTFEKAEDGVSVHSAGTGEVPAVADAVSQLEQNLYGAEGVAWSAATAPKAATIEIGESQAPETMTFDQAVELGIITVIGEYTTEFSNEEGTENRNHNIKLVCDLLDNSITTANGGTWSFNEHTGDTNMDPPFASAGSIVNGEYVDSIGGGICQVATTVFNAVFEAGLDVVQRKNHSLYIASYPTGRDVGVSYPELDFVWANNLKSDVLMKTAYTDTSVTVKLYSVYTGYTVESVEGEWEEGSRYQTVYEEDDTLSRGEAYMKTSGENGSRITVTRTVKDKNGEVISETEFESDYEPKNEVYAIGSGTDTSDLGSDSSEDEEYEDSEESSEDSSSGYDEYDESSYDESEDTSYESEEE